MREKRMNIKDGLIQMALDELGVPDEHYPAPVSNAVDFLKEALKNEDEDIEIIDN